MPEGIATHGTATMDRRAWLAKVLMGIGLGASYGVLAIQGLLFLLPAPLRPRTRRIFVGPIDRFAIGGVQPIRDLEGNEILVKRVASATFQAFSSTCPHLGCKVHWQDEEQRFFCPCHGGVFDAEGRGIAGPPADAGQRLFPAPLIVDLPNGVVYLEVEDRGRKRR